MSTEAEEDKAPYRGHVAKLESLAAKRSRPFNENVLRNISESTQIFDLLGGDMELPEEVEAELWMSVVAYVMQQGGAGIRVDGAEWSVLDMLLAVATKTDEFPVLLLAEIMLGFNEVVVELRGRPVHAGQLYNATYQGWSKMEDIKERARHHFKFGFLLLTIGDISRSAEQLRLAQACDPTSGAKDLLLKMLAEKESPIELPDGTMLTREAVLAGATIQESDDTPATAASAAAPPRRAEVEAPRSAKADEPAGKAKKVIPTQQDNTSSGPSALVVVVAIAASVGIVAALLKVARKW